MGIKYLTRLRLGLSHINDHKFRHNFQDRLNSLCPCTLVLITGFRAGLAGLNLGYPQNPALKPRKSS